MILENILGYGLLFQLLFIIKHMIILFHKKNRKKLPIVCSFDNLNKQTIFFSRDIFALIHKVKIYGIYIIVAHSFETYVGINIINNDINQSF